jgi:uncharacterized protein DUF5677
MSFERDGFFSPDLDQFRTAMRTTGPSKVWFDYALDLNRIGFDLLRTAATSRTENALFAMHGIFVRTHQSFQAALVLAERGLIGDARTVVRSGIEGAIAIQALGADASFVQRLIDTHHVNQRKTARLLLGAPQYLATYSQADIAAMRAAVAAVDAMETPTRRLRDISWADVAAKHCPDLYQLLYRSFSNDGTHATLSSLDRYVVADANMQITAFKVAPDGAGVVEVLSGACLLFIWAVDPFAAAANRPDITERIAEQLQRFGTLPGAFPGKAPAVA